MLLATPTRPPGCLYRPRRPGREYFATDFEADADSPEGIAAEATRIRVAKEQEAHIDTIMDTRPMTPEEYAAQAHSLGLV